MGCTCSIDHIRAHGSYWASRHSPIGQLDTKKFSRVTIDNLNFYIKYAKSLPESSTGAKKMLNLLTAQVTHQKDASQKQRMYPLPLLELAQDAIKKFLLSNVSPKLRNNVLVQDFANNSRTHEGYYLQQFQQDCFSCTVNRLPLSPSNCSKTFIESLRSYMPHWTPPTRDNVVYGTIDEALREYGRCRIIPGKVKKGFAHRTRGIP